MVPLPATRSSERRDNFTVHEETFAFDSATRPRSPTVMKRHLFVCTNPRSSGRPACGAFGERLVAAVQQELIARGTPDVARVTPCGCLGPCFDGPNAVVYPDGVWYAELELGDASALAEHLVSGTVVAARRVEPPGEDD